LIGFLGSCLHDIWEDCNRLETDYKRCVLDIRTGYPCTMKSKVWMKIESVDEEDGIKKGKRAEKIVNHMF